ncbi:MAG: SpoVR family protein [Parcubacteria group bacterium]|nr:SpoVR family protein [Parcubacteria group bacterium]
MVDAELLRWIRRLEEAALTLGLRGYPVEWVSIPSRLIPQKVAYGGTIPPAYPSLRFGQEMKQYELVSDILQLMWVREVVRNTNPARAFLIEDQGLEINVGIAAHVLAHSDFFANNVAYRGTSPETIVQERGAQYERMAGYWDDPGVGSSVLTQRIEACRSVAHQRWRDPRSGRMTSILRYLAEHCPRLNEFERDVCGVVDAEAALLAPMSTTRYMNEGWATHCEIELIKMVKLPIGFMRRVREFHNSLAQHISPGHFTMDLMMLAYSLGCALWHEVPSGLRFKIREHETDDTFAEKFLSQELVTAFNLLAFTEDKGSSQYTVTETAETDWNAVKKVFVSSIGRNQFPDIRVVGEDGDTLHLRHFFDGRGLRQSWRDKTMQHIAEDLWRGVVVLETVLEGKLKKITRRPYFEPTTEVLPVSPGS